MKLHFIFLIVLNISCGSGSFKDLDAEKSTMDDQFVDDVQIIDQLFKDLGLPVDLSDLTVSYNKQLIGTNAIGYAPTENTVWLNPDFAEEFENKEYLQMVIVHEMGHSVFGRDHEDEMMLIKDNTDTIKNNNLTGLIKRFIPLSIMFNRSMNVSDYVKNKEHYIKELYTKEISNIVTEIGIFSNDISYKTIYEIIDQNNNVIYSGDKSNEFYDLLY